MMILLKFILAFIISFLILAFPVGERTLFSHLHEFTAPWVQEVFQKMKAGVSQSSDWSRKVFTNSSPVKGEILSWQSSSSRKKREVQEELSGDPMKESYTPEEREFLRKILEEENSSH